MDHYGKKNYEISGETTAKVTTFILGSAIVASCTYLTYKFCSWLFKKSDEQIFQEALNAYHTISKEYKTLLETWSQEIHCPTIESLLTRLPIENSSSIYHLKESLDSLLTHKNKINERLQKLKKDHALADRMRKLNNKLKGLHKSLKCVYDYLSNHYVYFDLVEKVHSLKQRYSYEISAIETHQNDEQVMHKLLILCIMKNTKKTKYPYIYYIEILHNALDELSQKIQASKGNYPHIEYSAKQLKEYLECIYSLVIIHNAYHQELQEQERNRLEEKKIEIERQKTQAQRDQARALEEQNWLRREELYNQKQLLHALQAKSCCNS